MVELERFLVAPDSSIREVMACIDRNAKGVALVVDDTHQLLGTVTDGDIRRAILRDVDLGAPVAQVIHCDPVVGHVGMPRQSLLHLMTQREVHQLPILDEDGRVVDLVLLTDLTFIPLCVPEIRGNEWKYIKECLDTNWVSSAGKYVDLFEQQVAAYVGTRYGVATVNGTAALHIALKVAGVQPDDEVLVSSLTFIAPVNAIAYCGAYPVFIDAEPATWNMDPEKVHDFLTRECHYTSGQLVNKRTGRAVRGILPVDILGHSVDMDPILDLARQYDLFVVDDATECVGAEYKGRKVGQLGDIACFSFNGNKIITAGGGGMIVTDNKEWAKRAKQLTTQGRDDALDLEYIHHEIGYNYRLTNIQAAMGVAQLEQLEEFIKAKRRVAACYTQQLSEVNGIAPPREAPWAKSTFWLYTILVDKNQYGSSSREVLGHLSGFGIQARPLWMPIHRQRPYLDCQAYRIEVADRLYDQAVSLPCSVGITSEEIDCVVNAIRSTAQ